MHGSSIEDELRNEFHQLKIDDSRVNKMIRRRSNRIQEGANRRYLSLLDLNFDVENNNLPEISHNTIEIPAKSDEIEYTLDLENIHYQRAMQQFTYITQNVYLARRKKTIKDNDISCECGLSKQQILSGAMGCGNKCINRAMYIECDDNCKLGRFCGNQRIRKQQNSMVTVWITEKKGYGLFASVNIKKDTFIMEFVGEVVSMSEFEKRSKAYEKQKIRHYYVMTGSGKNLFDATQKGNLSRFVNHSCDPNAETQKWTVDGESRVGIFSKRPIKAFEEITMNYQFERFGDDAQQCFCEAKNCTGWIGA